MTTRQRQSTFAAPNMTVGGSIIVSTKGTRNLGVFFHSKLDLKLHISNICWKCYFQLRQLRTVCRSLQPDILKTLLHLFVPCRFDYCNSLYAGLLACDIAQLQSVQNAVARLFDGALKYDSVTPVLRDVLYWLPIKEGINFKIGVLTYKALNGLSPSYLLAMLGPVAVNPAQRRNRSANRGDITVLRAKNTIYNVRSFAVTAPMLWTSFPVELRCISSMNFCCKRLKTYLFRAVYNIVSRLFDWSWLYNVQHSEVLAYGGSYINSIIIIIIIIIIIK